MQPNIILLPDKLFCQQVFNLRKQLVDMEFGNLDPREKVLPHTTILYFEEEISKDKIGKINKQLDNLQIKKPIVMEINKITSWEHKLVGMFNISPLHNIKKEVERLVSKIKIRFNTEYIKIYGDTIGNHMKLARQVENNKIDEAISLFENNIPSKISFDRVAFIGYETEEKDILWEKKLSI
jgi:2'-5' RNA ligase